MKKLLLLIVLAAIVSAANAQLPNGSLAPNLDVTDINGNNHNLEAILAEGKQVIVVFSATWSGPDWQYFSTNALQDVYNDFGPNGTNELEILYVEADMSTTIDDVNGTGTMTQGDYVSLINFPMVNLAQTTISEEWVVNYFPLIYLVCPSGIVYELGQQDYNDLTASLTDQGGNFCGYFTYDNNAALTGIVSTLDCGGTSLEVGLYNSGINSLTACSISVEDSQGYSNIIEWTGNLAQNETVFVSIGDFVYDALVEVNVVILTPDENANDNAASATVYPTSSVTSHIQIDLLTDNFPGEISWTVTNSLNEVVLQSPYYNAPQSQHIEDYFLSSMDCYQFHIYDSFGDGLAWEGDVTGHINVNSIDADGNVEPFFIYDGSYQYTDLEFSFEVVEIVPVSITGTVYHDANENGYKENSEVGIGGVEVHLDELVTYTNPDGSFIYNDVSGDNDALDIVYDNTVWPTNTTPTSIDVSQSLAYSYAFGLSENDPNFNLNYSYSEPWFFCGFDGYLYLTVSNAGNQSTDGTVSYALDPLLSFINATPTPTSIDGNVVTWDIADLAIGNSLYFYIEVLAPSFEQMGEEITHSVELISFDNEGNVTDNDSGDYTAVLACSYDPNDKAGAPAGVTDEHNIMNGTDLEYLIRFQNTGNYQAFNIHVLDALDSDLNWNTFQLISTSHYCQPTMNMTSGEIDFYFPDINLPDSTANEAGSHGFIRYRISPQAALPEMTTIENTAYIYFDFNPAVITNTTLHTISDLFFGIEEADLATLQLFPMPASDMVNVTTAGMTGAVNISVTDMFGRIALDCGNYYSNNCKLDISALPAGIYNVVVRSVNTEQTATAKLVVKK